MRAICRCELICCTSASSQSGGSSSQRRYGAVMREVEPVAAGRGSAPPPIPSQGTARLTVANDASPHGTGSIRAGGSAAAATSPGCASAAASLSFSGGEAAGTGGRDASESACSTTSPSCASLEQAVASLLPPGHPGSAAVARWLREDGLTTAAEFELSLAAQDRAGGKRVLVEHGVKEAWADAMVQAFWARHR